MTGLLSPLTLFPLQSLVIGLTRPRCWRQTLMGLWLLHTFLLPATRRTQPMAPSPPGTPPTVAPLLAFPNPPLCSCLAPAWRVWVFGDGRSSRASNKALRALFDAGPEPAPAGFWPGNGWQAGNQR